jgi:ribonuclease D
LDYARQDTHHLIALRERLKSQLLEKGLLPLAEEDFRRLCLVDARPDDERDACWHINGAHDLSPQQMAVLQELCKYRDEMAHMMNRPLFKVMGDHTLRDIASACPGSFEELKRLPGMTPHQLRRHGKALLQAVQRGLQAKPIHPPRNARPDDRFLARVDALKQWRKLKGRELEVESDIILPRDLVYQLATQNPLQREALKECMREVPWRMERFGEEILKVLGRLRK